MIKEIAEKYIRSLVKETDLREELRIQIKKKIEDESIMLHHYSDRIRDKVINEVVTELKSMVMTELGDALVKDLVCHIPKITHDEFVIIYKEEFNRKIRDMIYRSING